jgi:diguanylate cyclase (GGDEF)-like protein
MREGIAERESKITALAYWDALTSLPNRAYFIEKIEELIAAHAHSKAPFSVLILNLNRFKFINDVLGHAFADQILKSVGERIRNLSVRNSNERAADVVARFGGDEFGILMEGVTAKLSCEIATRILKDLETPISIDDQTVDIGASVGVASFPEHSTNLSFLISRAEIAMYTAKSRGLNILVYDPIYDQSSQENLTLLSELKAAIAQNELVLYVQPKLNLETAQMTGVEALVRWMHPKRGFMPPDSFIPFAEQTGYVREITLWMLNEAAVWASKWQRNGLDINIAVNLSVRDLMDLQLPQKVEEILAKNNLKHDRISLEITESTIMDDPERALSTVKQLHALGLKLAIDDFGTGYSSLAYLKQLPVSELKIDKSFVLNMENDLGDHMIVRSTIDLGRNLSLKIIAEGVENEKTWHMLKAAGCHFAQGYFMSKPIPAKDLEAWILKWENDIQGEKASLRQVVALEI